MIAHFTDDARSRECGQRGCRKPGVNHSLLVDFPPHPMLYDLFSCGYLSFVPVRFAPNLYALGVRQSGACLVPLFSQARWLAARCDCLYFPIQRKISFDPSRLQVAALLLTYIRTLQRGDLPSLPGIERVPSTVVQYCSSFLQTPLNRDTARSMPFGKHLSTSI